jgi:hypothetical protein
MGLKRHAYWWLERRLGVDHWSRPKAARVRSRRVTIGCVVGALLLATWFEWLFPGTGRWVMGTTYG